MIAFLLALLLWMVGQTPAPAEPAPAPHGVTVSPAAPAPAGVAATPSHGPASPDGARAGVPAQRSAAAPTVAGSAPDPVAAQLPEEVTGRQIDCADGLHVGTMTADGTVLGCP